MGPKPLSTPSIKIFAAGGSAKMVTGIFAGCASKTTLDFEVAVAVFRGFVGGATLFFLGVRRRLGVLIFFAIFPSGKSLDFIGFLAGSVAFGCTVGVGAGSANRFVGTDSLRSISSLILGGSSTIRSICGS